MPDRASIQDRVRIDGKFFRAGPSRFRARGVTYGAFRPNAAREPFPDAPLAGRDLDLARDLGANTLRVYDVPPPWLLEAAAERDLRLFVSLPWEPQAGFLDTRNRRRALRTALVAGVRSMAAHPALFAVAVGNEIPPDILRWCGVDRAAAYLDELAAAVHDADPGCLCTYANFPPTEYLRPRELDFVTFNVFLHSRPALAGYLAHLQTLAGDLPLVLGECGVDSVREGLANQAGILDWTVNTGFSAGLAGVLVFSLTDEWFHRGAPVEGWAMGLTDARREPRPAFAAVRRQFLAPHPVALPPEVPRVSVVVASYNAARTLRDCLESLLHLDYPNYEVLVIDDGSIDETPEITVQYPQIRTLRLRENLGLSHARNLGIRAATGSIIAFTDADCRADPEWLRFLVADLAGSPFAGIGGSNLLPPDDPPIAAAVFAAPGGPAHVLLDERRAEHLPGCNMAFWKWALEAVGGFDPVFHQAGDDVDLCWRLQRRGWTLGFSPSALVWHHRRSSLGDYLRQQAGYGAAEALLLAKHPAHFNALGSARWEGRIGGSTAPFSPWHRAVIYRGIFATAQFQRLYQPAADGLLPFLVSLEYHVLLVVPLFVLAFSFTWLWPFVAVAVLTPPLLACVAAGRAILPAGRTRWWSRPFLALLFYLQPLVRGMARHHARLSLPAAARASETSLEAEASLYSAAPAGERAYWSNTWRDRQEWIHRIVKTLEEHGWPCRADTGWSDFDLEVHGTRWARLELVTVAELTAEAPQTLRCRLRRRWTLSAGLAFWGLLGLEALLFGIFDVNWKGLWIPPVTLGALAWFLRREGRALQCRLGVLLDLVAKEWGLAIPGAGLPDSPSPNPDQRSDAPAMP